MATNENMVTERTTDGDKPAKIAKVKSYAIMTISFDISPFLELGIGFNKKVIKSMIIPTCKP